MSQKVFELSDKALEQAVEDHYGRLVKDRADGSDVTVAEALGYTANQLSSIPSESMLGLGCGNPVAAANLKPGETVVDLGSGAGVDVFLAASKVGDSGHAIGIDGSQDMIDRSRATAKKRNLKPPHVSFVLSSLAEPLPVASNSVDCVISNCVLNLVPHSGKLSVLKEIHRILKPGGRIMLDDIVAKAPIPDDIRNNLNSYVTCISGAITIEEYSSLIREGGLEGVKFVETGRDINVCASESCCKPSESPSLPRSDADVNKYVASYQISAVKTAGSSDEIPEVPLLRWWDAYPKAQSTPPSMTIDDIAAVLQGPPEGRSKLALIDVRRNDHAGGHVRGSEQWAAQSFYDDLPEFLNKHRDVERVVFYCGSSSGRGPRCAGWYQDHLNETGTTTSNAFVMTGGVKAWLAKFGADETLVDRD